MDKCSWKKCRLVGNYISVAERNNKGTFHLCQQHWIRSTQIENGKSIQENLSKVAMPCNPNTQEK